MTHADEEAVGIDSAASLPRWFTDDRWARCTLTALDMIGTQREEVAHTCEQQMDSRHVTVSVSSP